MLQLSECKWCSDTCRDYIQKYSYIIGIQFEMLKTLFFRTLGFIQSFTISMFSSQRLSAQHVCKSDHKVSSQEPRTQGENKACKKFGLSDLPCVTKGFTGWEQRKNSATHNCLHSKSSPLFLHMFHCSHVFCFLQIKFVFYSFHHQKTAKCLSFLLKVRCHYENIGMHPCSSKLKIYKRIPLTLYRLALIIVFLNFFFFLCSQKCIILTEHYVYVCNFLCIYTFKV